jgi:hypothetical protein
MKCSFGNDDWRAKQILENCKKNICEPKIKMHTGNGIFHSSLTQTEFVKLTPA